MPAPTRHVVIVLTEREAEQIHTGQPDERAWRSLRRKTGYALSDDGCTTQFGEGIELMIHHRLLKRKLILVREALD